MKAILVACAFMLFMFAFTITLGVVLDAPKRAVPVIKPIKTESVIWI